MMCIKKKFVSRHRSWQVQMKNEDIATVGCFTGKIPSAGKEDPRAMLFLSLFLLTTSRTRPR